MPHSTQASTVEVKNSPFHGRGLFAAAPIRAGDIIAAYPLLILSHEDTATVRSTLLHHYVFYVDEDASGATRAAVAFGEISMCNHSPEANADFVVDAAAETVTLTARQALRPGDEILIDYEEFADEII
ncbi:SET domain-containing protein [Hyphomonas johnsonii]|uniref:SET domain-containing protein n=1 Tax=Hyphomonas johnsonii MHS-2 TaxID=1280950 RepID=A0A059FTV9_9PROT|nr:SET domain-containing protein-lysine N-methyltransferase [Hyphomonas johnsonii]KCZ94017.1 SET domain-containing protein [Hyphomonas johnsonii MHS-2]